MKTFKIQGGDGRLYNEVIEPAAVYDAKHSVLYKIGEKETMEEFFEEVQNKYRKAGFHDIADDVCLMLLPKDQEEIDKVFQICDYIGKLHQRFMTN